MYAWMEDLKFMRSIVGSRPARFLRHGMVLAVGCGLAACVTPPPRVVAVAPPPPPQKVFVYPTNGQSPQQTDRDRYECHVWAVQQTGVDPSRPGTNPSARVIVQPATPPGANTASGAITGAILGTLIGGPNNGGAGFILGAATGAVIGSAADANAQAQAKQTQAQINQAAAQGQAQADAYRRALSACLEGRGYTVS
jgi:hypothetical protein